MSIDHGKVLALAERVAGLAHMTLGKESREEREAIERELRALAQPAEAVLDRPARVAGRDFQPGQPVQQVIGRANAHYNATHDAAQGDGMVPVAYYYRRGKEERGPYMLPNTGGGWLVAAGYKEILLYEKV